MATQPCAHHWIIEPARGKESRGVCKNCGETRMFKNAVEIEYGKEYKRVRREEAETQASKETAEALPRALEAEQEE